MKPDLRTIHQHDQLHLPRSSPGWLVMMTVLAVCVDLAAIALIATSGMQTHISTWLLACLALLTVGATQQEAIFGDETALSGSMIVLLTVAGVFAAGGPLWLVAMCGLLGGLSWEHVRDGQFEKIAVNTSCTTISALAAAELANLTPRSSVAPVAAALLSGAVAGVTYWLVDNGLVAMVLTAVDRRPLNIHLRELTRSETLLVPFGVIGFIVGYCAVRGLPPWGTSGAVLALVATAELVVIRRRTELVRQVFRRILPISLSAGCAGVAALMGFKEGLPMALLVASLAVVAAPSFMLERIRPGLGPVIPLAGGVAAAVVFRASAPIAAPLVVTVAGVSFVAAARRATLAVAGALGSGAVALAGTAALLPTGLMASLAGSALSGAAFASAYLLGTHSVSALNLYLRVGSRAWVTAFYLMCSDARNFLIIGVGGAISGWLEVRAGLVATSGVVLGLGLAVATLVTLGSVRARSEALTDDQLVDVVRSGLLDLPASQLPDNL